MVESVMNGINSQEEKIPYQEKLNNEYEEAKLKGFLGTFEEYLAVRDYT